jgi:plastocyanin
MPTRALFRPLLATLFATLLVVGVAACGDDDDTQATGDGGTSTTADDSGGQYDYGDTTSGGDADAAEGAIVAVDFKLSDTTVAPGAEIVLQNDGDTKHTATSDEDGLFDLEADGGSTSDPGTAPDEPGDYTFHCEIHSSMTATLTVEG